MLGHSPYPHLPDQQGLALTLPSGDADQTAAQWSPIVTSLDTCFFGGAHPVFHEETSRVIHYQWLNQICADSLLDASMHSLLSYPQMPP